MNVGKVPLKSTSFTYSGFAQAADLEQDMVLWTGIEQNTEFFSALQKFAYVSLLSLIITLKIKSRNLDYM